MPDFEREVKIRLPEPHTFQAVKLTVEKAAVDLFWELEKQFGYENLKGFTLKAAVSIDDVEG